MVKRVILTPPSIASERVRNATRIVKEAIDAQGLSDLDISPHTPGDSPADKNWKKYSRPIKAEVWDHAKLGDVLGSSMKGDARGMGLVGGQRAGFVKVKE
jgi:hypothetical protein